jgi:chromosome segregation ATPase
MPTQEERLAALEQAFKPFQKEIARHIQETEENTTILLGVIRHQGQDIKRIFQHLETIDARLDTTAQHLATMDQRLDTSEQHLATIDKRLNTLEQNFNQLNTKSDEHTRLLTQILARLTNFPGTTS